MMKKTVLAEFLGCDVEDIKDGYTDYEFLIDGNGYQVLTDKEADNACFDYIEETLWAFIPLFLEQRTGLPEEAFDALQPLCENANATIRAMIDATCGIDAFVAHAIEADGRGHLLASYDGEEHCRSGADGVDYYIYQE